MSQQLTPTPVHERTKISSPSSQSLTTKATEPEVELLALWKGLKVLPTDMQSMWLSLEMACRDLVPLDSLPRHDSVVENGKHTSWLRSCNRSLRTVSKRTLGVSNRELEDLASSIKGCFQGDLKVRLEDRLQRHLAEARELQGLFEAELSTELPMNKPYQIRRAILAQLYIGMSELVETATSLRRLFDASLFESGHFRELYLIEGELYRMRASIKRWRDNPTQKLGGKMTEFKERFSALGQRTTDLRSDVKHSCEELGVRFLNRAGPVPLGQRYVF
ncbi:MAG TPA: hypothetical protein V6C97_33890 [Oculatellaceae cyanobacterium]